MEISTADVQEAVAHQWCRCLSVSLKAGDGQVEQCF